MLYDTHKRYGQVAGAVAFPFVVELGVVEVSFGETFDSVMMSMLVVGLMMFIAWKGSMFGAEFPDIDSYESRAANNHKILKNIFKVFNVKHRGKFSHDFVSQSIFWGIIFGSVQYVNSLVTGQLESVVISMVAVYVLFTYVGVLSHLVADALTTEGVWFAWIIKVRFMPVFIKKVGFGSWKPFKNWFNTNSGWETFNYRLMTFILPFAIGYSVLKVMVGL